jgi:hypothetical protein
MAVLLITVTGVVYAGSYGDTKISEVDKTPVTPPDSAMTTTTSGTTMVMAPEVDTFNTNLVMSLYSIDRPTINSLRQAGWSWGDIYLLANTAAQINQPIMTVANWRSQGMTYDQIASNNGLTPVALTSPFAVRTMVAGFVTEYGYQPIYYLTNPWGTPVLTRYEAERFSNLGYTWQDIAVAANISAKTGHSIHDILSWRDRGYTWQQIARQYSLDYNSVLEISMYPFVREPSSSTFPEDRMMPVGAGSMQPTSPGMTPTTPSNY